METRKKIILLGLCLLIVAGCVVALVSGSNVELNFRKHKSINLFIKKPVEVSQIKTICDEVFKDKKVIITESEVFGESVNIKVESITDEEKSNLINKVNEKYGTELKVEDVTVRENPKVRIRDFARPYLKPMIISIGLTIAYMIIRFRKLKVIDLLGKLFLIIALTEAALFSIIVITKIPVSPITVNLMIIVAIVELLIYINKLEKSEIAKQ